MRQRWLFLLVIPITVSLVGLVALQYRWIQQSIKVKQERFDQSVQEALAEVAGIVELQDAINIISPRVHRITNNNVTFILNDSSIITSRIQSQTSFERLTKQKVRVVEHTDSTLEVRLVLPDGKEKHQSSNFSRTITYTDTGTHKFQSEIILNRDSADGHVVTINREREALASEINRYNQLFRKMAWQLAVFDRPVSDRIDSAKLEEAIRTTLQNHGIFIPWEFGIFDDKRKQFVLARTCDGDVEKLECSPYRVTLFPNDLFNNTGALILHFPGRESYLYQAYTPMLGLSVLFIIILAMGFATTMHIIFKQKKLSDMKSDFINNMTHELKTPISTISLASEMLRNPAIGSNDVMREKYAGIIYEENKRLSHQVERVLQLAQLERGELKLKIQKVNLHDIINEAINRTSLKIEIQGGKLQKHLALSLPEIEADEVHLTNVIYNLLDNAIKYSKGAPEITIETAMVDRGVKVAISDKGIGMSKETQKHIFEKFYRLQEGNVHNVQGFGLGLSYVKLIVEAHGGSITVRSQLGKGSTFEIYLPIKPSKSIKHVFQKNKRIAR